MNAPTLRAACTSCGKTYRVPSAKRTYPCKACGGKVVAGAEASSAEHAGADPQEARRERGEATRELSKAQRAIKQVRWVYILQILFSLLAVASTVRLLADPAVPVAVGWFTLGVGGALLVLFVAGAFLIPQNPLLWSVTLAAVFTALRALDLAVNGPGPWLLMVFQWAWVVVLWLLVLPCRRVSRLIDEHPDLYAAHSLRGTKEQHRLRSRRQRSTEDNRAVLAASRRTAWTRAGLASGLALAGVAGSGAVVAAGRPESAESAVERLQAAWEAEGTAELSRTLVGTGEEHGDRRLALGRALEELEWHERRPTPAETLVEFGVARGELALVLDDESTLYTEWTLGKGGWTVDSFELPPPPLEPVLERFAAAWGRSSASAVAGFFSAGSVERMTGHVQRMAEKRDWGQSWPVVQDWVGEVDGGRARIDLRLSTGSLGTRWRIGDEFEWVLTAIDPPD